MISARPSFTVVGSHLVEDFCVGATARAVGKIAEDQAEIGQRLRTRELSRWPWKFVAAADEARTVKLTHIEMREHDGTTGRA
jgi:hypothetical protein